MIPAISSFRRQPESSRGEAGIVGKLRGFTGWQPDGRGLFAAIPAPREWRV